MIHKKGCSAFAVEPLHSGVTIRIAYFKGSYRMFDSASGPIPVNIEHCWAEPTRDDITYIFSYGTAGSKIMRKKNAYFSSHGHPQTLFLHCFLPVVPGVASLSAWSPPLPPSPTDSTHSECKLAMFRHSSRKATLRSKLEGNIVPRAGRFVSSELPKARRARGPPGSAFLPPLNLTDTEVSRHHVWTERPITQLCLAKRTEPHSCDQLRIRNPGGRISIGATREDSL